MREIKIKLFKFSELSKEVQKKVVSDNYEINIEFDWWNDIYLDAKEIGLQIDMFDIYNHQIEGVFTLCPLEVAQNILNSHGDGCGSYAIADGFLNDHAPLYSEYLNENSKHYESQTREDELQELENVFLNHILHYYLTNLNKDFEYRNTEESIVESIESNEYEFTENGKFYHE